MHDAVITENEGLIIISIYDAITIQNIYNLEKTWNEQMDKNPQVLAINFTKVERVDSIGLSHLVKLSRGAIIKEIDLIFYGLSPAITDLFKVARLENFFNILTVPQFKEKYAISPIEG